MPAYARNDDAPFSIFDENQEETNLGKVIGELWKFLPSTDGDLMLHCWIAGQNDNSRPGEYSCAILAPEIMQEDLKETPSLYHRALSLVYGFPHQFRGYL